MSVLTRVLLLFAAGLLSLGCQSEKEGVEILCRGMPEDQLSQVDPAMRAKVFSDYMANELSNGSARELFKAMADMSPGDRGKSLEEASRRLGIVRCPTASMFGISALLDQACFSALQQAATNLGVKARYRKLEPTKVQAKAASANADMITIADGL